MKRIYFFAILLPAAFHAQTFSETTHVFKNFFYSACDVADFNNDGEQDIVFNGALDHDNDGYIDETFNEAYTGNNNDYSVFGNLSAHSTHTGGIRFIDFNNDGIQEIVSTGLGASGFVHYRFQNNGSGFIKIDETAGKGNSSIEVFDFNHDGLQDYGINGPLYSGGFTKDVSYYENSGNGFVYTKTWLSGTDNGSFKVVDIDNDQLLDVAVMGYDVNNNPVFKTYKNVNGTLQLSQDLTALGRGKMSYADFNADGFQDFVAIGQDSNHQRYLGVFINDGAGNFTAHPIASEGLSKSSVDVGDLNNDGYYDFAIIGDKTNDEGAVNVFIYNPATDTFDKASGTSLYNLGGTGDLKLMDFNGDHNLDILMTGFDWPNMVSPLSPPSLTKLYQNTSSATNLKPTAPTNLNLTKTGNTFNFTWNGATDDKTPVDALQYEITVGTTPGGSDVAKYIVTTPSWFLTLGPSIQDVYWSVKAIDASKAYSASSAESTLGINDLSAKTHLSIHPNPASEKVYIKGEKISAAEIYSAEGKKINAKLNNDQSIDVSGFSEGMYILKIKISDSWVVKKLIIE